MIKRIAMSYSRYRNQSFLFFIISKLKNIQLITSISYLTLFLAPKIIVQNFVYIVIFTHYILSIYTPFLRKRTHKLILQKVRRCSFTHREVDKNVNIKDK